MSRSTKQEMREDALVVFLGPSLSAEEARRVAPCTVLPPARQGDVWRALDRRPAAIALVDGLFEAVPSVWHHEILDALESGVAVFGGASMGALRAAELWRQGMVGVGQIFAWYRDGAVVDDSEVALLHAGPEHGFEAFTVPLVNVRHAAAQARSARVLSAAEAEALMEEAGRIGYQERTWALTLDKAAPRWRPRTLERWRDWSASGIEDLKAADARACIEAAAAFAQARAQVSQAAVVPVAPRVRRAPPSSLVRRRRLVEGTGHAPGGTPVVGREILDALVTNPEAAALAERGLRTRLLAGWARELGLQVEPEEIVAVEREWLESLGVSPEERDAFFAASGMDERQATLMCEELALEKRVLDHAQRMISDGPSWEEGLAFEARRSGLWADEVWGRSLPKAKRASRRKGS